VGTVKGDEKKRHRDIQKRQGYLKKDLPIFQAIKTLNRVEGEQGNSTQQRIKEVKNARGRKRRRIRGLTKKKKMKCTTKVNL